MNKVSGIENLKDKKVLLRVDFDVPMINGIIDETFRLYKQKDMISYLLKAGAQVALISHITAVDSFKGMLPQLENIIGHPIKFLDEIGQLGGVSKLSLLENLRKWPGEKSNDKAFAEKLSKGFDLYINNAFSVSHRKHASVSAVTELLPSHAGSLLEEETVQLEKIINFPPEGKIFIMGGAKAETKVPVIKNVIDKAEKILIGGVLANDILKERGADIGNSIADANSKELLAGLDINDDRLVLPEDFNIFENKILDIGPKSIATFEELIKNAKMIIWNGPVGLFEDARFSSGTHAISRAIVESNSYKIIGGGDTIAAINKLGLLGKFSAEGGPASGGNFVSTGGGAMLAFLAGDKLPGLEALGYYK